MASSSSSSSSAGGSHLSPHAILYMVLLALQFGLQPILTKNYTPQSVCRSTVVLMQETCKFMMGGFMLWVTGSWKEAISGWNILTFLAVAGAPAALYCVQNLAALVAYQNLDPLTFNVLNQTKTLSAALCCYLIIGRKQSQVQIISLLLLFASALVIEKIASLDWFFIVDNNNNNGVDDDDDEERDESENESPYDETASTRHYTHGVAPVLLASFISGLAGALSQKNLQQCSTTGKSGRNSILFSMELCIASIFLLSASLMKSDDGLKIRRYGFFHDWTPQTFIPILTNAAGGIVVGLVTKYAGSVRKGFALIFGLLLSGILQACSTKGEGGGVTKEQMVGGVLASLSLWLHSTHPYQSSMKKNEGKGNGIAKQVHKKVTRKARKED